MVALALMAGCADGTDARSAPTTTTRPACPEEPEACTLRQAAARSETRIGVALPAARLDDAAASALVAAQFNALTAENEMKWTVVQPERGRFAFAAADRLVAFADGHDMVVRGHTLVWGQAVGNGVPPWLAALTDPDDVDAALRDHISTVVGRYRGRIPRWDVVNEPLAIGAPVLDDNVFSRALGPDYVRRALDLAHAADPAAELWINEHSVESQPAKADALVALVEDLLAAGAPLHGVGLQTHLFTGAPPAPGVLSALVRRLRALGVAVALTELDLPVGSPPDLALQAEGYGQVVRECLAAGCEEVTVWGLDDGATWLDAFLGRERTDPLLFDRDLRPKPAFTAVRDALLAGP